MIRFFNQGIVVWFWVYLAVTPFWLISGLFSSDPYARFVGFRVFSR